MPARHDVRLRLLATLFASIAAVSCARLTPANNVPAEFVTLAPGSTLLASGALLSDTMSFRMIREPRAGEAAKDAGTGRFEWQRVVHEGKPVLLLVRSFEGAGATFADTSMVAAEGFAPLWEAQHFGARHMRFTYDGARVVREVLSPDSAAGRREHRYDAPVFHFNEVELLARAVPLRTGFSAVVPLYSEGDDAIEHDTLTVLGRDSVGAWNVRFADPAIVSTYGIDPATRHITRYEVTSRKQGIHSHLVIAPK